MTDKQITSIPNSQTIWNAILTVIGAALLAALGFLYNEVINLKEIAASVGATRFTQEEAEELRSDITLTLTTVDKRMAIMENNTEWIQTWVVSGKQEESNNNSKEVSLSQLRERLEQLQRNRRSGHSHNHQAEAEIAPPPPTLPVPPVPSPPTAAPAPKLPSPDNPAQQAPKYDLRQKKK